MKRIIICAAARAAAVAGGAAMTAGCLPSAVIMGSGHEAKGAFNITADYTELAVANGIVVEFSAAMGDAGIITADEEVLEHVVVERDGDRLKVDYAPLVSVQSPIATVVTMPLSERLNRIEASQAARVISAARLLCSSITVEALSAGEINLNIDARRLTVNLEGGATFGGNVVARNMNVKAAGAAKCTVEGSVDHCKIATSGGAAFQGAGLVCRRADTQASGKSSIEIAPTEEIDAEASSGAEVRYVGPTTIVRRDTSSGGTIREM